MYRCPWCGKVFVSLVALKTHVHMMHYDIDRCPVCGARVKGLPGLTRHCVRHRDPLHKALYWLSSSVRNNNTRLAKARRAEGVRAATEIFVVKP